MQGISAWVPIFNCKKIEIIPRIRPKYYVYHNNRQVITFGRSKSSLSCMTIEETTSPVLMFFLLSVSTRWWQVQASVYSIISILNMGVCSHFKRPSTRRILHKPDSKGTWRWVADVAFRGRQQRAWQPRVRTIQWQSRFQLTQPSLLTKIGWTQTTGEPVILVEEIVSWIAQSFDEIPLPV